jgi:hypothetical protein
LECFVIGCVVLYQTLHGCAYAVGCPVLYPPGGRSCCALLAMSGIGRISAQRREFGCFLPYLYYSLLPRMFACLTADIVQKRHGSGQARQVDWGSYGEEDGPGSLDIREIHKHTAIIAVVCR